MVRVRVRGLVRHYVSECKDRSAKVRVCVCVCVHVCVCGGGEERQTVSKTLNHVKIFEILHQ